MTLNNSAAAGCSEIIKQDLRKQALKISAEQKQSKYDFMMILPGREET